MLQFRRRVYPDNDRAGDDAHFRWRFLRTAGADTSPRAPFTLLAVEGDEILGQWAGIDDRVWAGGRTWPVTWMVDLVVAPEHRDTMAAMALMREAVTAGRTLLATGVPARLLPFYEVFRWRRIPVGGSFYAVCRPRPLVDLAHAGDADSPATPKLPAAVRTLLPLSDRLLPLLRRARSAMIPGRGSVELLPAVPDAADGLFHRLRELLAPTPVFDAAALRWKLEARPCGRHELLGLPGAGGQLRGLAVLKLRRRPGVAGWGEVAAILVHPEDGPGFHRLLGGVEERAHRHDLDFLRLRCSVPALQRRLRPPWWLRRDRPPITDLFLH
ncbi:MAG: GNAT family N-acetyltransferase, partial [Deltaproteobacteria bacterium]